VTGRGSSSRQAAGPARGGSRITYPTGRLVGVIDEPSLATEAALDLAAAGYATGDVAVLVGRAGGASLGSLGPPPGPISRLTRVFQFLLMDQTPDFLVYEWALADGRAVVAVRVAAHAEMRRAATILERHGAHFLNHFGRLSTEEVSRWRGPEPEIPDALRR
jgi:hypothetical protein